MSYMPQDEVKEGESSTLSQLLKKVSERTTFKVSFDDNSFDYKEDALRRMYGTPITKPSSWVADGCGDALKFLGHDLGFWIYVKMILDKARLLDELERSYQEFKEKK